MGEAIGALVERAIGEPRIAAGRRNRLPGHARLRLEPGGHIDGLAIVPNPPGPERPDPRSFRFIEKRDVPDPSLGMTDHAFE